MISKEVEIRVRYKDTDKMGVVYHANYIVYYEVARTELFRDLGLPYAEMEAQGIMTPILEVESKYIAPAYYDEVIRVRATLSEVPMVKLNLTYEVFNEENKLINTGRTVLAFVNAETRRPCRAPEGFVKVISEHIE